jgi:hypothetical protein
MRESRCRRRVYNREGLRAFSLRRRWIDHRPLGLLLCLPPDRLRDTLSHQRIGGLISINLKNPVNKVQLPQRVHLEGSFPRVEDGRLSASWYLRDEIMVRLRFSSVNPNVGNVTPILRPPKRA